MSNEINGIPVVDPNFLTNLNKNLPANQEIRVKRIYHVNKPEAEPEINEVDDDSNDSGLSYISNPASVVRTNPKQKKPKHNKVVPYYGNVHPYLPPIPCRICASQGLYHSLNQMPIGVPHMNTYPVLSPHPHPHAQSHAVMSPHHGHGYYTSSHQPNNYHHSERQMQPNNRQPFLPAINYPRHNINVYDRNEYYNHHTNNRNDGRKINYNKPPQSYKNLYHNRNKLVDYTYDKYNPQKSDRNGQTVQLYKGPENHMY